MKSLYVHFPFCESKCHYCDFYSLGKERTRANDPNRFEQALFQEAMQSEHLLSSSLNSIFFGGGTPSMTPPESMARALAPLKLHDKITADTEWTMEANPSSITLEKFREFRQFGINRVSMGVQAFRADLLQTLGRVHSAEQAIHALEAVFEAGFDNVSVDLLCGVPNQSEKDLQTAMETFLKFPITHLSCYLLTLPPHHRMYSELPNEDTQLNHLLFIHDFMSAQGFEHYEISNFAKPGKKAKHNLNYWKGASYLGLGPSAHSYDATTLTRWKNISSLHRYADQLEKKESIRESIEVLSAEQHHLEQWMLALRLNEGFPEEWLRSSLQKSRAQLFESQGLIENHPTLQGRKRLTPKGFAVSDPIIRALT